MWLYRFEDTLNVFSHTWHLYSFSPLWILLCLTSSLDIVNRLLQTVHSNGFSPEWLRLCTARSLLQAQHLPHSVHLYLPVWIFIWQYRPLWDEKRLSHWVHRNTFSPVCLLLCIFKPVWDLNRLWHTAHKYGLGMSSRGCSVISLLSASLFTSDELPAYAQYSFNITEIMWHIINSSTTFTNIMRTCDRVGYTTFQLTQHHINTQKHSSFQCTV